MFVTFVPLYAQDQGVKVGQIGLIFGSQALCNALSRIPFGRLSDRVSGRNHLVTAGLIGLSVSIAGLGMAQGIYTFLRRSGGTIFMDRQDWELLRIFFAHPEKIIDLEEFYLREGMPRGIPWGTPDSMR